MAMPAHLRTGRIALAAAFCAALASCMEMSRLVDIATAERVAGLADPGFVSLPVGVGLSDKDVRAEAMAACFAPCAMPLALGVFTARGQAAGQLRAVLDDPSRLARDLQRGKHAKAGAEAATIAPLRLPEEGLAGFTVSLGTAQRPVLAVVLARAGGTGAERFVFALGASPDIVPAARAAAIANLR